MEQAPSAEAYHEVTRAMYSWEVELQKLKAVKGNNKVAAVPAGGKGAEGSAANSSDAATIPSDSVVADTKSMRFLAG